MNRIIFLTDGRPSCLNDFWINKFFVNEKYNYLFLGLDNLKEVDMNQKMRIPLLHLKYFMASLKCILKSSKNDLIIVWLDTMGVYTYVCSRILFKRRKIIILNIMAPREKTFKSNIRDRLYHFALNDKNCFPTVNNLSLIDIYRKDLNLTNKLFFVLKDSIIHPELIEVQYKSGDNYVFFGGAGGRDFELMIEIAKRLPEVPFVFVVKRKSFPTNMALSDNISIFFDTSRNDFNLKLSNSNLLALPIKVDTPAGILVIITAGLKSKLVISSNTVSIREYITNNKNGILLDTLSAEAWCKCIEENFNNEVLKEKFGKSLQKDISNIISNEIYIKNLLSIINAINNLEKYRLK